MSDCHQRDSTNVLRQLDVNASWGLTEAEAVRRLKEYGRNELAGTASGVPALNQASLPLGDRRNMVYMGTSVTAGRGQAVVTATGMNTELGRVASLVQAVNREPVPLQRRLGHLGRRLAVIALFVVAVIFTLGLLRGEDLKLMFLTAVSIGVAAIPEGLPACNHCADTDYTGDAAAFEDCALRI